MTTLGASMPEASVNENSDLLLWEKEIRTTGQIFKVQLPAANPRPDKGQTQFPLRAPIAFAPDGRHNAGTGRRHGCEYAIFQLRF